MRGAFVARRSGRVRRDARARADTGMRTRARARSLGRDGRVPRRGHQRAKATCLVVEQRVFALNWIPQRWCGRTTAVRTLISAPNLNFGRASPAGVSLLVKRWDQSAVRRLLTPPRTDESMRTTLHILRSLKTQVLFQWLWHA